jgi:hypothetical protein
MNPTILEGMLEAAGGAAAPSKVPVVKRSIFTPQTRQCNVSAGLKS